MNLSWTREELPEKERTKHVHGLHPYLGKFIPQIAEELIKKYSNKDDIVCDPFMGSGTTAVESYLLERDFFGVDISDFNILLSRVKTGFYDLGILYSEIMDVLAKTKTLLPRFNYGDDRPDYYNISEYLSLWYHRRVLNQLLCYKSIIFSKTNCYCYKDVLKIILSKIARSVRLVPHFNLDHPKNPQITSYYCHKHKKECHPIIDALPFFHRYSKEVLNRIREYNNFISLNRCGYLLRDRKIFHNDSRFIDLKSLSHDKIDLVITSPPYLGMIDYHKQHQYAFELLDLPRVDGLEIGSASGGRSKVAQENYIRDVVNVFKNFNPFIKFDGYIILIVNDRYNLYNEDFAKELGYKLEDRFERDVSFRTGLRKSKFKESVLVYKKGETL